MAATSKNSTKIGFYLNLGLAKYNDKTKLIEERFYIFKNMFKNRKSLSK